MSTHFETNCPNCQHTLRVRLEYVGKTVACKHCGESFRITKSGAGAPASVDPLGMDTERHDAELIALRQQIGNLQEELDRQHVENELLQAQVVELERRADEQEAETSRLRTERE